MKKIVFSTLIITILIGGTAILSSGREKNPSLVKGAPFTQQEKNQTTSSPPSKNGTLSEPSWLEMLSSFPIINSFPARRDPPDLEAWLERHAQIRTSIFWVDETGSKDWDHWDDSKKDSLREVFAVMWNWYENGRHGPMPIPAANPPPNIITPADEAARRTMTYLSPANAWDLYRAYVAHSLVLEMRRSLPWSLEDYDTANLYRLLNSQSMLRWDPSGNRYAIMATYYWEDRIYTTTLMTVPAPPTEVFSFFMTQHLIGSTRLETIENLLAWVRENFVHFIISGDPLDTSFSNNEGIWQYRGVPPASRVIAGTIDSNQPSRGRQHYTLGCRGTVDFLTSVLRALNIPSENVFRLFVGAHAKIFFPSEGLYLFHGDDPYDPFAYSTTPIPIEEFLIDERTFEGLRYHRDPSRRINELAVRHLPEYLLINHCVDLTERRNHRTSRVFYLLSGTYSLDQLENREDPTQDLWQRINVKIGEFGGCGHIPNPFPAHNPYLPLNAADLPPAAEF